MAPEFFDDLYSIRHKRNGLGGVEQNLYQGDVTSICEPVNSLSFVTKL
jgi:hypothetical protein